MKMGIYVKITARELTQICKKNSLVWEFRRDLESKEISGRNKMKKRPVNLGIQTKIMSEIFVGDKKNTLWKIFKKVDSIMLIY